MLKLPLLFRDTLSLNAVFNRFKINQLISFKVTVRKCSNGARLWIKKTLEWLSHEIGKSLHGGKDGL